MKSQNILIAAFSVFLFAACTNETESDLLDQNIPNTITYTNSIKSIIDSNCISCHGTNPANGASISLTTYQNVKDAVLNKGLIDKISKTQDAAGMMPYGGTRLSQSTIDQVVNWKNTGFTQ
jgi:mono/diheme cytochrome c family protein